MIERRRRLLTTDAWTMGASVAAFVVATACGSDDATRSARDDDAGAGESSTGGAGDKASPAAGAAGASRGEGGAAGATELSLAGAGGTLDSPSGGVGGSETGGVTGASGANAAAGAPNDCEANDARALEGYWTTTCNGYTCKLYIAASGAVGNGCTNGQYETGVLDDDGGFDTYGEGGPYAAYSTKGTLTRTGCDELKRDYIGQIPPDTGPEVSYSCTITRAPDCAPTLLETLAGEWDGTCGTQTCLTTFTVEGDMTSTCSNGQGSIGTLEETGAFSDEGGGGGFDDYSTTGVIALTSCDSFLMPYTWQMPPQQGKKTSSQCTYTRHQE